jgi:flotillin
MAGQKVAEEDARAKAQSAAMKADGAIRVAQEEAQKIAEEARAKRQEARLNAEVVVPAEAERRKAVVQAEAERQKAVLMAEGEAQARLVKMEAEGKGVQAILDGKAAGYKSLVAACGGDASVTAALLLVEKLTEVAKIQAEAVKNLPVEKVVVWDSGGDSGGLANLGGRFMSVLPPMHDLARMVGLELPEFLGKAKPSGERASGGAQSGCSKPQS